ncbi:MAG: hypothetical protein ACLFTS_03110 [Candidatus Paceibacterota bacterium]
MIWKKAGTYEKKAPHEYVMKADVPAFFERMQDLIKNRGVYEEFTIDGKTDRYKYYYRGKYKYWIIMNVLNRARVK